MSKGSGNTKASSPNSEISYSSRPFGTAGEYTVYRVGRIDETDSGGVFFGSYLEDIAKYSSVSYHKNEPIMEYRLNVQNPLVVDGDEEATTAENAYKALTAKRYSLDKNGNTWQVLDTLIDNSLNNSKYDAILYKVNGKPLEIFSTPQKMRLSRGKQVQHDFWSKAGYVNKQDAINDRRDFILERSLNKTRAEATQEAKLIVNRAIKNKNITFVSRHAWGKA